MGKYEIKKVFIFLKCLLDLLNGAVLLCHIYLQIFGEDYTPTLFDRKVEMLFGWFNSATEEDVEIYFDHDYYYFAHILDSMFPSNVVLK